MKLQTLGPALDAPAVRGDVDIAGLTADSREVRPGWLFAAMPGSKADGARFVPDAVAKGAAAILAGIGRGDRGAERRAGAARRPSRAARWR